MMVTQNEKCGRHPEKFTGAQCQLQIFIVQTVFHRLPQDRQKFSVNFLSPTLNDDRFPIFLHLGRQTRRLDSSLQELTNPTENGRKMAACELTR